METVIIAGGDIQPEILEKYCQREQKQNLIAVDKGLEALYQIGIMPNHIVGDFDSVDTEILKFYQDQKQIIFHQYNPQKDNTDTDIALRLATKKEQNSSKITILGALGKRIDHTLSNIHILKYALQAKIPCQIIDKHNKIYLINESITLKKNEMNGRYISLIPLTTTVEGVTLKGFQYPLQDDILVIGESLGVSNEIIQDIAFIELKKGILIVIESKD